MSVEGDARPERQSSSPSSGEALPGWAARGSRWVRLGFGAFVLLHLGCQAFRARTDGAVPEPGVELERGFVSAVLVVLWLPFLAFAVQQLRSLSTRSLPPVAPSSRTPAQRQARALAIVEPFALCVVLVFSVVHGVQIVWPLLSGALVSVDLRPTLIAALSSTLRGLPLQAVAYVCAVGAACFYAVRQAQRALPEARAWLTRSVIALGVLGYLLGSYAVIRCASGAILP